MKRIINDILVVEGKADMALISSLIDCEIVVTNGYELSKDTMDYLKESSKHKQIIVLTDPDNAGEEIRKRIINTLPNSINLRVDKNKCNKRNKHGVAECDAEEIIAILEPYFSISSPISNNIQTFDLINLGIDNTNIKEQICKKLHLGKCNTKLMVKRLNSLNYTIDDVSKALKEIEHGNK